jgi:putative salt-induced outer membrane protein YdiY
MNMLMHPHSAQHACRALFFTLAAIAGWGVAPQTVSAQDAPRTWRNQTEFSLVMTGGNASSSTLGLRNTLRRRMAQGEVRFDLESIRTDASRITRQAIGSAENFRVEESRSSERTGERFLAQARLDRNLSERTFAYGSTGWERNPFAGFDARTVLAAGAGTRLEGDAWQTKVGAALTYTFQSDVDPDPSRADRFGGVRGTLDHGQDLSEGSKLELKWVVDANAQQWSDTRGNLLQSVSTTLSDRLALKTTVQLIYQNDPPSRRTPLVTEAGVDTGTSVLIPLGKWDRSLSVALVVTL